MSVLGFLGCGGGSVLAFVCAAGAGVAQLRAKKRVKEVKVAVEQELPKEVGKIAYAARQCVGTPGTAPLLPAGQRSLCSRITVEKSKSHLNSGLGFPIDSKGSANVVITPSVDISKRIVGFPEELNLRCAEGLVRSSDLAFAHWRRCATVEVKLDPKDAVDLLKQCSMKVNFNASRYGFTLEYFPCTEEQSLTIVGDYTRTEDGYNITPNRKGLPFIVTPLSPEMLVKNIEEDVLRLKKSALKCMGVSVVLFMRAQFFFHL